MAGQVVDTTKYKYYRVKVRGPDGKARYTAGSKDSIAKSLFGFSREELLKVAEANDLDLTAHASKNVGHFRMILGQTLRNIITKGRKVKINGATIGSLKQSVSWPKGYTEEDKGTHDAPVRMGKAKKVKKVKGSTS